MEREVFFCECAHPEHHIFVNKDEAFTYIFVSLADNLPFLTRAKRAFQYLLGRRSKYGMYAEILLSQKSALRLAKVLSHDAFNPPN
jgi:hypothetical protein